MKKILSAVLLHALLLPVVNAQSKLFDQEVQLKTCNISISANPFTATTFIEMEFYNPKSVEVEGFQYFKLNKGQVVTAFQLDLNGKYRDGSIEEKWKANRAYSSIVGKRIDPAILQMSNDHSYSLRIYPIPAQSSRKVTLTIDQLMKEDSMQLNYELPLNFLSFTENFKLNINVSNAASSPVCNKGLLQNFTFSKNNNLEQLDQELKNIRLNQPISFSIPLKTTGPQLCVAKENSSTKFLLRISPQMPTFYPVKTSAISIFWDASSSSSTRSIKKEIDFLERYIIMNKITKVTVNFFNQQLLDHITWDARARNFDVLRKYLSGYRYAGATTFGNLDFSTVKADIILVFSDGYNSFGKSLPKAATVPVNCIYSSLLADQTQLYRIVGASGGMIVNLNEKNMPVLTSEKAQAQNFLLNYSSVQKTVVLNEKFPLNLSNNLILSGTFKNNDYLQLIFGNSSVVNKIESIYLQENEYCGKDIYKKVQMLKSYDSILSINNWHDLVIFGLKEKVVTPYTSFLVLERIEDYIKYNIAPPKELEEQCAQMNYVYKSEYKIKALKTFTEEEALQQLVKDYNSYISWWNAKEELIDLYKPVPIVTTETGIATTSNRPAIPDNPMASLNSGTNNTVKEVIVTSSFQTKRTLRSQSSNIQYVSAEQLNVGRISNINNALAGKVAGIQVRSQSYVALGRSSSIRLRGENGLLPGRGPVYVVDGMIIPDPEMINVDDIENVTVLQGPAAAALFGSEGANGAIVISNKKGRRNYYYSYQWKEYKLKDLEDVEYMDEIKDFANDELWDRYTEIEKRYKGNAGFYFDMADYFFERKLKDLAVDILFEAIEACKGNKAGLKAAAYVLEDWKYFDKAIRIYQNIITSDPADMYAKRDLALAYFQNKEYQQSVNTYYKLISFPEEDYYYEARLRIIAMNEMNAVISLHKNELDLSAINLNLVKSLPLDLRITLESNYGHVENARVKDPEGNECSYSNPDLKNGGQFTSLGMGYFNNYYHNSPGEYSLKKAIKGSYRIKVNAYNYYSYTKSRPPFYLRLVIIRNFQKADQRMEVQHIVMDNQYGSVEVADIKW